MIVYLKSRKATLESWTGSFFLSISVSSMYIILALIPVLTHTTLSANSADDKLIFFLIFPEKRFGHFMQIVS